MNNKNVEDQIRICRDWNEMIECKECEEYTNCELVTGRGKDTV